MRANPRPFQKRATIVIMSMRTTWGVLLAAGAVWAAPAASAAPASVVKTDQVRAELIAHAPQGIQAGQPLWLGLRIEHKPHWHTYWKNPGDSGLATSFSWTLPAGFTAGDIEWPTPGQLPVGPLMNFGYEGTVLLPVRVTVPTAFAPNKTQGPQGLQGLQGPLMVQVKLEAQWLVCKEVCIPESGEFALDLPVRSATAGWTAEFEAAWGAMPKTLASAQAKAEVRGESLEVEVRGLPDSWQGRAVKWFPETAGVLDNASRGTAAWVNEAGAVWKVQMPLSAQRSESPRELPLVLVADAPGPGIRVSAAIAGAWPKVGAEPTGASTAQALPQGLDAAAADDAGSVESFLVALALALLGGALLNLMPCVFPVLSLKVMGFATQAQDRRHLLQGGLAYTGGVVASFVALAGAMLLLRSAGEHIGWGFQLQSPTVVAGLAGLFTLMGLNLAGVFEWGSVLPSSWASMRLRQPLWDSALTGVLAVAVASPCTAPFMGASIGLAVTWPAPQALAVFAALGLGMSLPYLVACAWPALARAMPKPGVWMVTFKQFMAFPMFATVVWLLWVLGQQSGMDAITALLGMLLAVSLLAWVVGSPHMGRKTRLGLGLATVVVLVGLWNWGASAIHEPPSADRGTSQPPGVPSIQSPTAGLWQDWSAERVGQALNEGRPVFVDFTAAWCVTCQFNKRTVLADSQVLADFAAKRALLLRADWTRRDPAITAELARMGRSGVPVYVLLAPSGAPAKILSEVLSVQEVRNALAALP
ncbi:MAG: hypothetical protein RI949_2525 [Pseudomonadota bacterium]